MSACEGLRGLRGCARVSEGLRGRAILRAWEGVGGCARVCEVMRGFARVCEGI